MLENRPEDALGSLVETEDTVDHSLTLFGDNFKARDASASKNHTIKP